MLSFSFTWSSFHLLHELECLMANSTYLLLQIQVTVSALRNTRGLPWPKNHKKKVDEDILDWLQAMFGFQVINEDCQTCIEQIGEKKS